MNREGENRDPNARDAKPEDEVPDRPAPLSRIPPPPQLCRMSTVLRRSHSCPDIDLGELSMPPFIRSGSPVPEPTGDSYFPHGMNKHQFEEDSDDESDNAEPQRETLVMGRYHSYPPPVSRRRRCGASLAAAGALLFPPLSPLQTIKSPRCESPFLHSLRLARAAHSMSPDRAKLDKQMLYDVFSDEGDLPECSSPRDVTPHNSEGLGSWVWDDAFEEDEPFQL